MTAPMIRAIVAGLGMATGRAIIDLSVESKPYQVVAINMLSAFGVGFVIWVVFGTIGAIFKGGNK